MPMVPGLTEDMPSRIFSDDFDLTLEDLFPTYVEASIHGFDSDIFNLLDAMPSYEPVADAPFSNVQHEMKRDCWFGKTDDLCLRECGLDCDPKYARRCSSNVSIADINPEECFMVNPQAVLAVQLPYSPYNDHSYHQTTGYPDYEIKVNNSYESESPSDDSGDEIVDVETVQDKVEPPINKVIKRRGRKPGQKSVKPSNYKLAAVNKRTIAKRKGKYMQQGRARKRQKWSKASSDSNSPLSSDTECGKRSNHNDMERKRRDLQKNYLEELRKLVPGITNKPKASKVFVLRRASIFIGKLIAEEKQMEDIKNSYIAKNAELQRRVQQLQKSRQR